MTRKLAVVPDAPKRAIALIRVSAVMGRGDDLTSPELQRHAIEAYALTRGMHVVQWVEAVDESASKTRSGWWKRLDQAVEAIEASHVEAVLVWKFSRAARHRRRWAVALDRVEVAGGVLESATEQLDTTTSTGRLARGMLAELSAWEAEVRSEGWRETHARRNREGLPHNTAARLGYRVVGKGFEPDPDIAPFLTTAYDKYLAGESHRAITEWLTDCGIRGRTGRPWTVRGIRCAMDGGFAAGLLHFGGYPHPKTGVHIPDRWSPAAHTPIITPQVWDRYQRARHLRGGDGVERRRPHAPRHYLTGSVRCSACDHSMAAKTPSAAVLRQLPHKASPGEVYVFVCYNPQCGDRHSVTAAKAEAAFMAWLTEQATDVEKNTAAAAADRAGRAVATVDRKHLEGERDKLASRLLAATRDHNSGLYDTETFAQLRDEIVASQAAVKRQLDNLVTTLERPRPTRAFFNGLIHDWDHNLSTLGKQQAVKGLEVTVTVERLEGRRGRDSATVRVTGGWE